jgi:hypothetical protein
MPNIGLSTDGIPRESSPSNDTSGRKSSFFSSISSPFTATYRKIELEGVHNLSDGERLTLKDNQIMASRGTLSDGLYEIYAFFRPKEARDQNRAILKKIADKLADKLSANSKEKFISTFLGESITMKARLTGAKVKLFAGKLKARLEIQDNCPDKELAEVLFKNQFPSLYPFQENKDTVKNYYKLGQIVSSFKASLNLEVEKQSINTAVQNFLDRNPEVSENKLEEFLIKYKNRTFWNSPSDLIQEPLNSTSEATSKVKENNLTGLEKISIALALIFAKFPEVSKKIAELARDDIKGFFILLTDLSDESKEFINKKGDILTEPERQFFIKFLLSKFTITKKRNPEVASLLEETGRFLAKEKSSSENAPQNKLQELHQRASDFLTQDQKNQEKLVNEYSGSLKEKQEKLQRGYQEYKNKQTLQGEAYVSESEWRNNPNNQLPKGLLNKKDKITSSLLSPDAQAVLKFIIQLGSQKRKQDVATSIFTTPSLAQVPQLPEGGKPILDALLQILEKLEKLHPQEPALKTEKTRSEFNRRLYYFLKENPTANSIDIEKLAQRFKQDLQRAFKIEIPTVLRGGPQNSDR